MPHRLRFACPLSISVRPEIAGLFRSSISPTQPLMLRQPRAENQSVFWRRDRASSHHDASPPPPHLGTSSLRSRLLPKPQRAGDRRVGAAPAAFGLRSGEDEAQSHLSRSRVLGCTLPVLASLEGQPSDRQTRHHGPVAPQGISTLLAIDLEAWSWATINL